MATHIRLCKHPGMCKCRLEQRPGPRVYRRITVEELHSLVRGPCLFARKFASECAGLEPLRSLLAVHRREEQADGADADLEALGF